MHGRYDETLEETLDPAAEDWPAFRALAHRMVDDALDFLAGVRDRPAWQSPPLDVRRRLAEGPPLEGTGAAAVYEEFRRDVLPYPTGNIHPRFWGWVMGTGSPTGVLAEMLSATMNCNVTGFDDAATLVERQVIGWWRDLFGLPATGGGLLVSGGSVANLVGLSAARNVRAGFDVRHDGVGKAPRPLVLYASREVHNSVVKAVETLGLGRDALRLLPVDRDFRLDLRALEAAIEADRQGGRQPFALVGCAGTVNTGATDDLEALAAIAAREGLWLHVDGAFGAMAAIDPVLRGRVRGLEKADSIAFDLHKWGYLPIEAGGILVRRDADLKDSFAVAATYLAPAGGGIAAGQEKFSDRGPQLSRGFRALKVWMVLKEQGVAKIGRIVRQNVQQAERLALLVTDHPELELLAPAPLNIVCFRYKAEGLSDEALDVLNRQLLVRLQEQGIAVPSSTLIGGRFAVRVAITNHRSRREDFDRLVAEVVRIGREVVESSRMPV